MFYANYVVVSGHVIEKCAKRIWFQRHIIYCKFLENMTVGLEIKRIVARKAHLPYSYDRRQNKNYIT
jgi:hypothetical protein